MEASYQKPPIIQRTFTIWFELKDELFYGRLPIFEREILKQLPVKGSRQNWALNFKSNNGKPDFSTIKPNVEIVRVFSKKDENGKKFFSIELEENRISFTLSRTSNSAYTFNDLNFEVKQSISIFLRTLSPDKVGRFDLDYINLISRANTPDFVDENDGHIHVERILNIFNKFSTEYESIIPPYDCKVGLILDKSENYNGIIRVMGQQGKIHDASAIRVDLHVYHNLDSIEIGESMFEKKLEVLHYYVLKLFHDTFTEEAKKAF